MWYGALLALLATACSDDAPKPGPPCGAVTCPSGYTCGSSAGMQVCRAPSGVPKLEHVLVIVMENTSLETLESSTNTPFLHSLPAMGVTAADYHGVTHPSLPNYIALTSGQYGDIKCDCAPMGNACSSFSCNILLGDCGCPQQTSHLGNQLEAAHKNWRNYAEDMGSACNMTSFSPYATKHVPFLYYKDVQSDAARCAAHVVDYSRLAGDLAGATPELVMIAPNLIHDMHDPTPAGDQNLKNGDDWLASEVPKILASSAYRDRGMLVIVWDEDDLSGLQHPDDPIPIYVLSPLGRPGYRATAKIDHYALLATIEDALALPRLGSAAHATALADFFAP